MTQDKIRERIEKIIDKFIDNATLEQLRTSKPLAEAITKELPDVNMAEYLEMENRLAEKEKEVARYHELIYAVEAKHPNETRHQTALRYIKERETGWREAGKALKVEE